MYANYIGKLVNLNGSSANKQLPLLPLACVSVVYFWRGHDCRCRGGAVVDEAGK